MKKKIVSPIAIDLGAKNTGVYFAHYEAGSTLDNIRKSGAVYTLEAGSYTYLMANRTARRHQRRGYDRRQMAKRLFKLIWERRLNLEWDADVQQTTSFLLNRRGFSFLTEEYDSELLRDAPPDAVEATDGKLAEKPGFEETKGLNFAEKLDAWTREGDDKVRKAYEAIIGETEQIRRELVFISRTHKLRSQCKTRKEGNEISTKRRDDLSRIPEWILRRWIRKGVDALPSDVRDLTKYLNEQDLKISEAILADLDRVKGLTDGDLKRRRSESRSSRWCFDPKTFDIEKAGFGLAEDGDDEVRKHLNHFTFALHKTLEELNSGGRHRSKYFKEVEAVLKNRDHKHGYLKRFCKKLDSDDFNGIDILSLSNLIGHISNLELKPLRKYFNDLKHQTGDYWDEKRLEKYFDRWILKEWRVGEKDKEKGDNKEYSYSALKKRWKDKGSGTSVIDFWLATDPNFTIPPYQDNNNRRPPKCQSLLLNIDFLAEKYPVWEEWLALLKGTDSVKSHTEDYEKKLISLESGKGKPYFCDSFSGNLATDSGRRSRRELDARVLQFIFDRVKANDTFRLNEVYSHAKKIRQSGVKKQAKEEDGEESENAREALATTIKESKLPDKLKTDPDYSKNDLFPDGSFFHLVCRYYKQRQRARDGRVFIHPTYRGIKGREYERTGRFDTRGHLLIYCNHKPRQKRYQMLGDMAGLLQVSPDRMRVAVESKPEEEEDDRLSSWLAGIKNLKTNCARASNEQKERRGQLKADISRVFGIIHHRRQSGPLSSSEVKKILSSFSVDNAQKLYDFCQRANKICKELTKPLYDELKQQYWEKELERNPATAVYLLAQINNIAFSDRSGYSSTCSVCSMDNAYRMQMVHTSDQSTTAKAQRIPAIPTRIIDGAVMRMARIVGGAIAKDKWKEIEADLRQGNGVCVPIITESNQFEFEPSREELVRGQRIAPRRGRVVDRDGSDKAYMAKESRIKDAGSGICPYTGAYLSNIGEIDHIIPRTSRWGTLNDEANLIYSSSDGNKKKGNMTYTLRHLNKLYKKKIFRTDDDSKIEKWIEELLVDGTDKEFKFGRYRNFVSLSPDEQTAFRHALFLTEGSPLRDKVISAMEHKNQTFVNGTQRYFADVLANTLYRFAKAKNMQGRLSFDYYGVLARPDSRGGGVFELRKRYEECVPEISRYGKSKDQRQQAYSHLIDAQLAFVIVADDHRLDGGMKLKIGDAIQKEPVVDKRTGEICGMLDLIKVGDDQFRTIDLKRRKAYDTETHHRQLIKEGDQRAISINYKIHRDSLIAEKFMSLIVLDNGEIKKGFSENNSVEFKRKDFDAVKDRFLVKTGQKNIYAVKKYRAVEFLMNVGREGKSSDADVKAAKILDGLIYRTKKEKVQTTLAVGGKEPATVREALQNWPKVIVESKFRQNGVLLPVYREWEKIKLELESADQDKNMEEFLRECGLFKDMHQGKISSHNKRKKVFSLPAPSKIGNVRLMRRGWDNRRLIQATAEESFATYGIKSDKKPHTLLSKNSIPIMHYSGMPADLAIEPIGWKKIPESFLRGKNGDPKIVSGEVIWQDKNRCTVRLVVHNTEDLSLPFDKGNWQGRLVRHESKAARDDAREKEMGANTHYERSEWKWFNKPFGLPNDRNKVRLKKVGDGRYQVEFTIQKQSQVKKWL